MPTPYAGNPANNPANIVIPDGSSAPSSTTFTGPFEQTIDLARNVSASIGRPGSAWGPAWQVLGYGSPLYSQYFHPGYDSNENLFLAPYTSYSGGVWTAVVWFSAGSDDGNFWNAAGSSGGNPGSDSSGFIDLAATGDPSTPGTVWAAALLDNSAELLVSKATYTGSWASEYTLSTSGTTPTSVSIASVGSAVVVGMGGSAGTALGVYSNGSGSWGKATGPTGTTSQWLLASSGSLLIACPQLATNLWTTTDGNTFTSVSLSFLPSLTIPVGLAYSALWQRFYMLVQGSANTTAIYYSTNGSSWTLVGNGPNVAVSDFAISGTGIVIISTDSTILGVSGSSRIWYSPDFGLTWTLAPSFAFQGNAAPSVGASSARVAAGVNQFFLTNSRYGRLSTVWNG